MEKYKSEKIEYFHLDNNEYKREYSCYIKNENVSIKWYIFKDHQYWSNLCSYNNGHIAYGYHDDKETYDYLENNYKKYLRQQKLERLV